MLNACNSEVRIVWKEKDNGHKVIIILALIIILVLLLLTLYLPSCHVQDLLQMEEKLFAYLHHEDFTKDNGRNVSTLKLGFNSHPSHELQHDLTETLCCDYIPLIQQAA